MEWVNFGAIFLPSYFSDMFFDRPLLNFRSIKTQTTFENLAGFMFFFLLENRNSRVPLKIWLDSRPLFLLEKRNSRDKIAPKFLKFLRSPTKFLKWSVG
jgi:hypothetical protein